jgi:hypothetical protein
MELYNPMARIHRHILYRVTFRAIAINMCIAFRSGYRELAREQAHQRLLSVDVPALASASTPSATQAGQMAFCPPSGA